MYKKQLNLLSSQKVALSILENMVFPDTSHNTLILSGESGSGKSTVVQEFLTEFTGPVHGYTTVRHRTVGGKEVAFQHILLPESAVPGELTLEYREKLPTDLDYFLFRDEDKVSFDRGSFIKLADYMSPGSSFLHETPKLMLWDEVGGEELLIDAFYQTLLYWLDRADKPAQIIVWKKQRHKSRLRLAHLTDAEIDLLDRRRLEILNHPSVNLHDLDSDRPDFIYI